MRAVPVAARLVRIDHVGGEHLARPIDHRDFHAGAHTRIETDHGLRPAGAASNRSFRLRANTRIASCFGFLAQIGQQFVFDVRLHLHARRTSAATSDSQLSAGRF